MTSAGPTKKPYRKAPPQHRETRHDLPALRDVQDGVHTQPEQYQVTDSQFGRGRALFCRHTGFGKGKSADSKHASSGEIYNDNGSSSWSLTSSNDKEMTGYSTEGSCKGRSTPPTLLRRVKSLKISRKHVKPAPRRGLGYFWSRSEEKMALSADDDDDERSPCPYKSRSLERCLVFKETAEVLAPRKSRRIPNMLPLKGILKQPGLLEVRPERSVEKGVRDRNRGRQNSPHLSPGRRARLSPDSHTSLERSELTSPIRRMPKGSPDKARFSQFLDEITSRVLSPTDLQGLGAQESRGPSGGSSGAESSSSLRDSTAERQREKRLEKSKPAAEKSPHLSRKNMEKQRIGSDDSDCRKKVYSEPTGAPQAARRHSLERGKEKPLHGNCVSNNLRQTEMPQKEESTLQKRQPRKIILDERRSRDMSRNQKRFAEHPPSKASSKPIGPSLGDTESMSSLSHWSGEEMSRPPRTSPSFNMTHHKESPTDADRVQLLQNQNEELRRRLAYTTSKMETMEREVENGRHYLEVELSRNQEELEKFKDKFRRLQNSYTASQRSNQDLEEKLHALIKRAEQDRKTLDWEIVELTNKLLDAKTTINKLEELNERYRQDCNLAVQLLKCNKSHFRNHKLADLPYELQDMVSKHLQGPQDPAIPGQDAVQALTQSDVVPTSVIARVLEKPESMILNSAKSSSGSGPVAEDVFVHVDMSGTPSDASASPALSGRGGSPAAGESGHQQNGGVKQQNSVESNSDEIPAFEKLNPYPTPPPPHPLYPGRKVIEFFDEKVRIPKNSPLPNCTYATRQAISLSLVQGEDDGPERHRTVPNSPASEGRRTAASHAHRPSSTPGRARSAEQDLRSSHSSPFSSPPQVPSAFASSASSEEDLLANWQRMFVDKAPPTSGGVLVNRTSFSRDTAQELQRRFSRSMQELGRVVAAYSDGEESGQSCSWTVSRDSSLDTDSTENRTRKGRFSSEYGTEFSQEEASNLLQVGGPGEGSGHGSPQEKRKEYPTEELIECTQVCPSEDKEMPPLLLLQENFIEYSTGSEERGELREKPPTGRQHRSPKRMGVHHLHRKDSLTRAQEHGNLLN